MSSNKLTKKAKLKSDKEITALFKQGKSFSIYPLRFHYVVIANTESTKLLVSAPKRLYKKAVDRNRAKRMLRESFRLSDHKPSKAVHLGISYFSTFELSNSSVINDAVQKGLSKLKTHLEVR